MSATTPLTEDDGFAAQPSALSNDPADVRLQLVWRLADVLSLPDGRTTANDRAMAGDMMSAVLGAADPMLRAKVAKRLSVATGLPTGLLRQLATDAAPIARAAIEDMVDVPEAILIEAAAVSVDHRRMLSLRDGMTNGLAEALLAKEESEITITVLGEEGVTLSPSRIEALVGLSRNDDTVRKALLKRAELRPSQAFVMFWWSDAAERRRILSRFSMDRTVLQDTLQPLFPLVFAAEDTDPLVRRMLRLIDRRHRPRGTNGDIVEPEMVERTLMASFGRPNPEFCHAVGLVAGVGAETATRVLHDPGGEPFAILAKSAGLSRGAFAGVLSGAASLREQSGGAALPPARQEALLATFDTVARDYARAVLQYWDWRPDTRPTAAPAPAGRPSEASEPDGYLGAV